MSAPTDDGGVDRNRFKIPPMPPQPPPTPAASAPPTPTAATGHIPGTGNPPIPVPVAPQATPVQPMPSAPKPAAAAPAPHPTAAPAPQAPVQAQNGAAPALTDDTIVPITLEGGVRADVKLADMRRKYEIGRAAEARLERANAQLRDQAAEIQRGKAVAEVQHLAQTNPEAAAKRLAELFGVPLAVASRQEEDDGLDPAQRDIQRRLGKVEGFADEFARLQAADAARQTYEGIRTAVRSYPAYAQDEQWARAIDALVAAQLRLPGQQANAEELVAQFHAMDMGRRSAQLTNERDQRASNVQALASIPPEVQTPALTDNSPPPLPKGAYHKPGGVKADFARLTEMVMRQAR